MSITNTSKKNSLNYACNSERLFKVQLDRVLHIWLTCCTNKLVLKHTTEKILKFDNQLE